jgi:hypothetical protein
LEKLANRADIAIRRTLRIPDGLLRLCFNFFPRGIALATVAAITTLSPFPSGLPASSTTSWSFFAFTTTSTASTTIITAPTPTITITSTTIATITTVATITTITAPTVGPGATRRDFLRNGNDHVATANAVDLTVRRDNYPQLRLFHAEELGRLGTCIVERVANELIRFLFLVVHIILSCVVAAAGSPA